MQPHQQAGECIQQALAKVWNAQAPPRQQGAVRQRIVEMASDEQTVGFVVAAGDHPHHFGCWQAGLGQLAQQPPLAFGQWVG